jgi:hypothetical protein
MKLFIVMIQDLHHIFTHFVYPSSMIKQYLAVLFTAGIKEAHYNLYGEVMTYYLNSVSLEESEAFFDYDDETTYRVIYEFSGFKGNID